MEKIKIFLIGKNCIGTTNYNQDSSSLFFAEWQLVHFGINNLNRKSRRLKIHHDMIFYILLIRILVSNHKETQNPQKNT